MRLISIQWCHLRRTFTRMWKRKCSIQQWCIYETHYCPLYFGRKKNWNSKNEEQPRVYYLIARPNKRAFFRTVLQKTSRNVVKIKKNSFWPGEFCLRLHKYRVQSPSQGQDTLSETMKIGTTFFSVFLFRLQKNFNFIWAEQIQIAFFVAQRMHLVANKKWWLRSCFMKNDQLVPINIWLQSIEMWQGSWRYHVSKTNRMIVSLHLIISNDDRTMKCFIHLSRQWGTWIIQAFPRSLYSSLSLPFNYLNFYFPCFSAKYNFFLYKQTEMFGIIVSNLDVFMLPWTWRKYLNNYKNYSSKIVLK